MVMGGVVEGAGEDRGTYKVPDDYVQGVIIGIASVW